MSLTKFRSNTVLIILLFLLLYSNYASTSFVYENRILFSALVILIILIRLFTNSKSVTSFNTQALILIFTFSYLSLLDLIKGFYASSLGCLMFTLIIIVINTYCFEKIFRQITWLNQLNNILSFCLFITAIIFFNGRGRNVFGIAIPYFTSYTSQPSLIPALLMLPLAIYLLFYEKYQRFYFVILTIALCFGGNAYVAIIIAFILYLVINKFSKFVFIALPFILMIFINISISYVGSTFLEKTIELRAEARKGKLNKRGALDWKFERLISGTERFAYYYDQIVSTKKNLLVGSSSVKDFQSLGSLILKFSLRGGILTLLSISLFFIFLLNELYKYNKNYPNKKAGTVLFYSLIVQTLVYNEMGFFSHYAIALFFIANLLLLEKNKEFKSKELALA